MISQCKKVLGKGSFVWVEINMRDVTWVIDENFQHYLYTFNSYSILLVGQLMVHRKWICIRKSKTTYIFCIHNSSIGSKIGNTITLRLN